MKQYKVGIIGGTGMVGQRFITLMENHPWFRLTVIAASARSAARTVARFTPKASARPRSDGRRSNTPQRPSKRALSSCRSMHSCLSMQSLPAVVGTAME